MTRIHLIHHLDKLVLLIWVLVLTGCGYEKFIDNENQFEIPFIQQIESDDHVTPIPPGESQNQAKIDQLVAFPGAEGFGANTIGGRGGRVIEVTSLADSGPGTLREAIEADGPRTIIFRVNGTIELKTGLNISNPYITIAGQTAPGDGITLRHAPGATFYTTLTIETYEVILRYLTIRRGSGGGGDALGIYSEGQNKIYNLIIDHCSLSWGVDEVANSWYAPHDYTVQWTIISEGLNCSTHEKGCHSKGFMLGSYASDESKTTPGAYNLSFHHNLMAHNGDRNPLVKTAGLAEVINNVIYNPSGTFSHVDMDSQLVPVLANYIGNYFKSGPDTTEKYAIKAIYNTPIGAEIYNEDNLIEFRSGRTSKGLDVVDPDTRIYLVPAPIAPSSIRTSSAEIAYEHVLADAGANRGLNCDGTFFWRRDAIDNRIIEDVINSTGQIIDDPSQVGGWLVQSPSAPCQDTDHDGMPDEWEEIFDLDPRDPMDGSSDPDGDGYTNLENYLNGTKPS